MEIKKLFEKIQTEENIALTMLWQEPIKNHLERQVSYVCKDKGTYDKYWLTIAYTPVQKYRLQETVKNITQKSLILEKYFEFNEPIAYGDFEDVYYVLYPYLEKVKRLDESNTKILYEILDRIYKNEKFTITLTEEKIEQIIESMISERCYNDSDAINIYKDSEELKQYKQILQEYSTIDMIRSHCDLKRRNILTDGNKLYLIGFEFGGIDLPVGFDKYCLNQFDKKYLDCEIEYSKLHKLFYKIHHTDNNAGWLKKWNSKVKINKRNSFVIIRENKKTVTIPIKKSLDFQQKELFIDLKDISLSPFATFKLVELINKRFDEEYTIHLLNSPYWFKRLKQNSNDELLFSGIINKDCEAKKTLSNIFVSSQIYVNYSRILPFLKPYWFRALLAILICIPIGSLDAVIALSLKPYMDLVVVEKSIQAPWYIPFGIVMFTIIQGMLNYIATYLNTWVGGKITNDLKMTLYKKLLTFQTAFFDKRKSGDIIFRFNADAETACSGLLENMKTFVSRLFSSLSLVCVLFYNSWQLALIASIVLGCAFLPLAKIRKRIKGVMDKSVAVSSKIITAFNETFAGNRTITAYNLKQHQENKFNKILSDIFTLKIKMVQRTSWLSPMMHVIVSIGIGLAIGYGSHLIVAGKISSGNFVSFITALIMLYTPIKNLGNNFNSVQFSFMAIERIFEMLNLKPTITDKNNARELKSLNNSIIFKNVFFEYVKNRPVLKDINFNINKGETIALVGNSGGGKSTIVNLIPRFYDVKSGSITIDGVDIRDYTLVSLRQNIAVVFQDNFLFSGTIRENIVIGNEAATDEMIQNAIEMAYLDGFVSTLKDGLDTQIGERGILLSGGQKQRVAIARAFLKDAPIIILDEATSALDNKAEAIVQKAIDNLMKDKTVFVIAHRLSTVRNANKIVVITQGEVVEIGTHEELMNIENGQYKALYDMQFKKQEVNS